MSVSTPLRYRFPHIFVHSGSTYQDPNQRVFAILFTFVIFSLSGNPEPRADEGTYTLLIVILSALPPPIFHHLTIVSPIIFEVFCFISSLFDSTFCIEAEENFFPNSCQRADFHLVLSNPAPRALLWASCCGIVWLWYSMVTASCYAPPNNIRRRLPDPQMHSCWCWNGNAMEGFEGA